MLCTDFLPSNVCSVECPLFLEPLLPTIDDSREETSLVPSFLLGVPDFARTCRFWGPGFQPVCSVGLLLQGNVFTAFFLLQYLLMQKSRLLCHSSLAEFRAAQMQRTRYGRVSAHNADASNQ